MATFTRTNGIGNSDNGFEFVQGTVHYNAQNMKAFIIDAQAALTNQDADAAGEVDQAVEAVLRVVQPLIYFSASTAQTITVITDIAGVTAADLEDRIQALGTINGFDLSSATVAAASSLTAA